MERIENPEKYQSKITFRKKVQKFLLKNILWIPIICLMLGLVVVLLIYRHHAGPKVNLKANLEETIKKEDYQQNAPKSKIEQFQEKITEKNQVKKQGRYERIVRGRDIVAVDYGKITYDQSEQTSEEPSQVKEDTLQKQKQVVEPKVKTVVKVVHIPVEVVDTTKQQTDTIVKVVQNPFATARLVSNQEKEYIQCYVYGEQEIASGSFIKLRLGESLQVKGKNVPVGTVFTGQVSMNANVIHITIGRIERYNVSYQVYDDQYAHGILINRPKHEDMEQAINRTAYSSAGRGIADLPYEVVQDVSRAILQRKRQKQRTIKLPDGYPIYIAKG